MDFFFKYYNNAMVRQFGVLKTLKHVLNVIVPNL